MQWFTDFAAWYTSPAARPVIFTAAILAASVIVSGLLAATIAKSSIKGLLSRTDRAQKASAIAALVDAATEASVWNSLTPAEQVLSDRAVGQTDIMVRLLPIKGAGVAANWASHQLSELKRHSATFGYQLDPAIAEFRDRMIEWQNKPRRARKIFQDDLERWRYENNDAERTALAQQDAWVAQQHHDQFAAAPSAAAPAASAPFRPTHTDTAPSAIAQPYAAQAPAMHSVPAAPAEQPAQFTRPTA